MYASQEYRFPHGELEQIMRDLKQVVHFSALYYECSHKEGANKYTTGHVDLLKMSNN